MRIAIPTMILATLPVIVSACEGECIVGITNAYIGNYTDPVNTFLEQLVNEVVTKVLPNRRYASPPINLIQPIVTAYQKTAYKNLETAIFPSYFHGKCQQPNPDDPDGPWVNPPGCPNPDCNVVCGTPGSMVHFFPKLRYLAFNAIRKQLVESTTPGSEAYQAMEKMVIREAGGPKNRKRAAGTLMPALRREEQAKGQFKEVMHQTSSIMERICGGTGNGKTNGLPKCSWEKAMKEFILSYP
ncbi:hypothetical protein H0H81_000581 [Sphagnurus paluster]|uniref:Uncharacterized protein n=1 Tax=Sphagnurus paluster TaxID=117069 RepID=A0A9P7K616_9AGAR|nr:hypothetical protein H0H81_000581 [Sphagnurus paluster]